MRSEFVAAGITVLALVYAAHAAPTDEAPASTPPSAVVQTADSTAPEGGSGCDHVNVQQGDHPLSPSERDRLIRQSTAICKAVTGSLDGP